MARHIAAKYGGKDGMYELFAAMPPFGMIKFLLLRAVQCSSGCNRSAVDEAGRTLWGPSSYGTEGTSTRKVMIIDISKAHSYVPTTEDEHHFVDLPPVGS